jgi:hypothetical protein
VYNGSDSSINGLRKIMAELQINLTYQWQTVYLRENVEYLFPMAISPFMRNRYKSPAVFKWDIHLKTPGDKKLVYIGEAQELCPRRLYGYLNPGQTQLANKKVNAEFRAYLKEKLRIGLEICQVRQIIFGGSVMDSGALTDKHIRRLVAEMLIVESKKNGFTVVDL